jgi:hypothetical protein
MTYAFSYQEVPEIYPGEPGYDTTLMWIISSGYSKKRIGQNVLAKEGSISGNLFQDQAGLTTVKRLTFTSAQGLDCGYGMAATWANSTRGFDRGMGGFQGRRCLDCQPYWH